MRKSISKSGADESNGETTHRHAIEQTRRDNLMYALERARIERQHERAEHALVLVGVRFTSDPEVLDDGRVLNVVPVLRRR